MSGPTEPEIRAWCLDLCRRAGVKVHVFEDGTTGMIDVPAKYVAVMDILTVAICSVARGDGLPELVSPIRVTIAKRRRRR